TDAKKLLASKLLDIGAQVIPDAKLNREDEIVLRENSDNVVLPKNIGITLVDFKLEDDFRSGLNIKKFSDYDEVLKYFRQISFSGNHSTISIKPREQKEIIECVKQIFFLRKGL